MCCCCPPAIKALFCLWVRNGFSKACVAGALTFFPPDPPMYKFRRIGSDGEELPADDVDGDGDEEQSNSEKYENEEAELIDSPEQPESDTKRSDGRQPLEVDQNSGKAPKKKPAAKKQSAVSALSERQNKLLVNSRDRFKRDKADAANGVRYELVVEPTLVPPRFNSYIDQMEAVKLYNKKAKSYIATVIYRVRTNTEENVDTGPVRTILYSHGNATDLGAMSLMQCYLARGLNVNVVMYDYSGYGESGGIPLEKNTYYDIETVYQYVVESIAEGVPERVILYGQSVGSGPSCYICSKQPAGGLILHSPFMSGMRVLTPSRALACLDIFPNIDRIKKVNCPVMVIHGMHDEEVDMAHGVALHNAVKKECRRDPWWVPDRGHNDICEGSRNMNEYIRRLKVFLDSMDESVDASNSR